MRALYVAAGGGGDGIAALALSRALHDDGRPAIASYSWDRFVLDPAPGPRRANDFRDLSEHPAGCWEVTTRTRLESEARSTLTLGASLTGARWFLLDPSGGASSVARQITAVLDVTGLQRVVAVDVGGDIIARGDEPSLRSPLADSLTLASLVLVAADVAVAVIGPGLDGELPGDLVHARCRALNGRPVTLRTEHVLPDLPVLDVHPSEATTLLAAAALGIRGTAEIRDSGTQVALDADSTLGYLLPATIALGANPLAQALRGSTSLDHAEKITIDICGRSELAYERHKATSAVRQRSPDVTDEDLGRRISAYAAAAFERGSTLATFRRITDAIGLRTYDAQRLRAALGPAADSPLPIARVDLAMAQTTTLHRG